MNKVYIMIGVPGSGKSTIAKQISEKENGVVISRDEIRFELLGPAGSREEYFSVEKDVIKQFHKQIKDSVEKNELTIVDATNLSVKGRKVIMGLCKNAGHITAINVCTSLKVCLERNSKREGLRRVPESIIGNMLARKENPLYSEGYDEIKIFWNEEEIINE